MERSALIYVSKTSPKPPTGSQSMNDAAPELGLGLATGTRLRARLASAASTAVRTPVLAVIEYNYERDGEIVVPAGAKAVGHIRDANRSGYVDIQFDSLLMPDGASVAIEAAATDLDLRPLKGSDLLDCAEQNDRVQRTCAAMSNDFMRRSLAKSRHCTVVRQKSNWQTHPAKGVFCDRPRF
jgi:hypothetical protein